MRLRPATPADAQAAADLVIAVDLAEIGEVDYSLADLHDEWKEPGFDLAKDAVVVEDDSGTPIGYAHFRSNDLMVAVDPRREGEGAGTALHRWAEQRGRERGESRLRQAIGDRADDRTRLPDRQRLGAHAQLLADGSRGRTGRGSGRDRPARAEGNRRARAPRDQRGRLRRRRRLPLPDTGNLDPAGIRRPWTRPPALTRGRGTRRTDRLRARPPLGGRGRLRAAARRPPAGRGQGSRQPRCSKRSSPPPGPRTSAMCASMSLPTTPTPRASTSALGCLSAGASTTTRSRCQTRTGNGRDPDQHCRPRRPHSDGQIRPAGARGRR